MIKITEKEMMENILDLFEGLSPVEFVEEYNRQFATGYIVDDVIWDYEETQNNRKENQNE